MTIENLHNLLKRYLDGNCTPGEVKMIDQWLENIDENDFETMSDEERELTEQRLWNNIASQTIAEKRAFPFRRIAAAASVALIIASASAFFLFRNTTNAPWYADRMNTAMTEMVNHGKANKEILLEDGSTVVLNPGASIAYPQHFHESKREILLEGQAFFKVSKNPARPFYVYYKNIVTHVLGTSFTVKTTTGEIDVSVCTGKVEVFEQKKNKAPNGNTFTNDGVVLTPNQKVVYKPADPHFDVSLVERPRPLPEYRDSAKQKIQNIFEDDQIGNVFALLSKEYGIDIITEGDELPKCKFSGDLTKLELYDKLQMICTVINATYEVKGTKILVRGNCCKNC